MRLLERRGDDALTSPAADALEALQLQSAQLRLALPPPWVTPRRGRRCATIEGFSLHANTHVHPHDRQGLKNLLRYGARGPISVERLSWRDDGKVAFPDGATHLVLSPLQLLRRLAALVPPPRFHLTRFHGVFAPNSRVRRRIVAAAAAANAPPYVPDAPSPHAPGRKEHSAPTRLPWA